MFSLSNTGDVISIQGNSWCNQTIDYSKYLNLANGNNYSLEKFNGSLWLESLQKGGTPLSQNSIINYNSSQKNSYNNSKGYYNNSSNSDNNQNNNSYQNNNNGSYQQNSSDNILLQGYCSLDIFINLSKQVFASNEFEFTINANNVSQNISQKYSKHSVRGYIIDRFGSIVKEYSPWTNQTFFTAKSKKYSPKLKEGYYQIVFNQTNDECFEYDVSTKTKTSLFVIQDQFKTKNSSISIEKIYLKNNQSIRFGDQFLVKLKIYKGNQNKYSIKAYLEQQNKKISEVSSINIYDKFQEYIFTVPIQINPNCQVDPNRISSIKEYATLIIEGLDLVIKKDILISGINEDLCQKVVIEDSNQGFISNNNNLSSKQNVSTKENINSKNQPEFQLLSFPDTFLSNRPIDFSLLINSQENSNNYKIHSYLYSSSVCYSCKNNTVSREHNQFFLKKDNFNNYSLNISIFPDSIIDSDKNYKIKIKIFKNNRKTAIELTKDIIYSSYNNSSNSNLILNNNFDNKNINNSISTNSVVTSKSMNELEKINLSVNKSIDSPLTAAATSSVYQSKKLQSSALIPLFLIVAIILILIVIWRKPNST